MFAACILCIRCGSWQLLGPSSTRFCERTIPWNWEGVTRTNLVCFFSGPADNVQWRYPTVCGSLKVSVSGPTKRSAGPILKKHTFEAKLWRFQLQFKKCCQSRFLLRHGDADLLSMLENTLPPADASKISIFQSALDTYTLKATNWNSNLSKFSPR